MTEETISQEFSVKYIDETRNYLIEERNQNELIGKDHNKGLGNSSRLYWTISFASLVGISIETTSSVIEIKIYAITATINKYKSIVIVLLAKSKLNRIEILTFKPLIDSVISHDEFAFIDNALKEYNEMKWEIKNLKT